MNNEKNEFEKHELLGKLRECLDPGCSEYDNSTMEQKIEILRKIQSKGMSMTQILMEYKDRYAEHSSNPLEVLPDGLAAMVDYLIKENL